MDKPIIYNGEEFKDKFSAITTYKPSLKMRLEFLFCVKTSVEHEVYTKEIMPAEKTICHVHIISIWDFIKAWNFGRKHKGGMEAPIAPCVIQSQE